METVSPKPASVVTLRYPTLDFVSQQREVKRRVGLEELHAIPSAFPRSESDC